MGVIGHHMLYKVTDVKYVRLFDMPPDATSSETKSELKYLQFFRDVDLTKGFYFSYTYDLTKSLQENIIERIVTPIKGEPEWEGTRCITLKTKDFLKVDDELREDSADSEGDYCNKDAMNFKRKLRDN